MPNNRRDRSIEHKMHECEKVLQYRFGDRQLLETCLTHASVSITRLASNERLEFLGDAILGVIVCEMLFHRFPEFPEGELTRIKSALVSRNTCADITEQLGLEAFLLLGKGIISHSKIPRSIMAAVFESLVAGVYLDGGLAAARQFVERVMNVELERVADLEHSKNFKSVLQQLSQKTFGETPVYRLLDEKGPDHSKCFEISAVIGPRTYAPAWGNSKKEAEQQAAQNALLELRSEQTNDGTGSDNVA